MSLCRPGGCRVSLRGPPYGEDSVSVNVRGTKQFSLVTRVRVFQSRVNEGQVLISLGTCRSFAPGGALPCSGANMPWNPYAWVFQIGNNGYIPERSQSCTKATGLVLPSSGPVSQEVKPPASAGPSRSMTSSPTASSASFKQIASCIHVAVMVLTATGALPRRLPLELVVDHTADPSTSCCSDTSGPPAPPRCRTNRPCTGFGAEARTCQRH